ncbi:DUF4402 domain-containing protein [Novosphingobium sp.]|uniref:DUF4402 domain-containing protein n=1 Tax=Novosphingobium sp. TaxID=1874826 RepID=UPI001EBA10F4|nr:DUF4402 domain-containing protein [Novosphingobium sp.]MBK6802887.1 DUF4402 domain-containing protein [Novosphingobium sp.]MBK9012265.1 DUF4402 domain-containing protein [Novosphingobium sp.]
MRNSLRIAALGAALAAGSLATSAHAAATATATATAEVLETLTLTAVDDLNFGQIAANTGGTVTVNADSTVASTGTLISTGTRAPATFTVTGSASTSVVVTLPSAAVNLTRSGGTETMSLDTFNSNPNGAFQLSAAGTGAFSVGGTLTVANGQVPGSYSGTFPVSVEYQ